ncbi:unnamed protein product [Chilo suppressalis]|uniref:OTU domain-containing protein n=1 Tax=Chilo suppressalis TaxID=168631 RepID=A0ABN8LCL5_CHISP|nr:unnamed protein product [Chilo suppressalis]
MADDASSSSGCAGNLVDNSINQDELIMKQQREIEKEISETIPLVGELEPLASLEKEYNEDPVYLLKFMEVVQRVGEQAGGAPEGLEPVRLELHDKFNKQGYSDYIVVYLRLVTSGQLQTQHDFYQNFIEGPRTVTEFCRQEVEPMYKESDHIHIIALSNALNVGVKVEYMDRGEGSQVIAHVFPEGAKPLVHLLYRPGHYDILYA